MSWFASVLHSIGIDQNQSNGKGSVMKIAILGTGMVGNAIGTKLVQLGHQVKMGSRTATSSLRPNMPIL